MFNVFAPNKLIEAKFKIEDAHKKEAYSNRMIKDSELRKFITRLASLRENQLAVESCALSDEEVEIIAAYIPSNRFGVKMSNLFELFRMRECNDTCTVLYSEWQDSYDNNECNEFIRERLNNSICFQNLVRRHNLAGILPDLLKTDDIPRAFGNYINRNNILKNAPLTDRLEHFGIREDSALTERIEYLFYTFCSGKDYLVADKISLLRIVDSYTEVYTKDFLYNFLKQLSISELQDFSMLAGLFAKKIGTESSPNYRRYITGEVAAYETKYLDWLNIFYVKSYFGDDERSMFWECYKYVNVKKYKKSNTLVMEMNGCYVCEFLGDYGPIYFFNKGIFEQYVQKWFEREDNVSLRSELYHHPEYYIHRQVHSPAWQRKMNDYILKYRYTSIVLKEQLIQFGIY